MATGNIKNIPTIKSIYSFMGHPNNVIGFPIDSKVYIIVSTLAKLHFYLK